MAHTSEQAGPDRAAGNLANVRAVLVKLLGAMMAPLGLGIQVPEELLEVRNMLATRAEEWKRQWLLEGEQKGRQEG